MGRQLANSLHPISEKAFSSEKLITVGMLGQEPAQRSDYRAQCIQPQAELAGWQRDDYVVGRGRGRVIWGSNALCVGDMRG